MKICLVWFVVMPVCYSCHSYLWYICIPGIHTSTYLVIYLKLTNFSCIIRKHNLIKHTVFNHNPFVNVLPSIRTFESISLRENALFIEETSNIQMYIYFWLKNLKLLSEGSYLFYFCYFDIPEKGQVYVWGCNKYGQCTQSPDVISQVNTPHMVNQEMFKNQKVVVVKSGWTHLVAQTGLFYFKTSDKICQNIFHIIISPFFSMDVQFLKWSFLRMSHNKYIK
jgi:hypothetical protein